MTQRWNHNIHYHSLLLDAVPAGSMRALDVGCGIGEFARELAWRVPAVDAIDRSADVIRRAGESTRNANVNFIEGDFMGYPFEPETYDFISALAVLHHLPFLPALEKMKTVLRSNGVLTILGLYKARIIDVPHSLLAVVVNQIYKRTKNADDDPGAPIADSTMTLPEIRNAASRQLPGAIFRTHLLWRYSIIWRKP